MPYTLGITIDGTRITDDAAKIIALSAAGLVYEKITAVTFFNQHRIHKEVSQTYGLLGCDKGIAALVLLSKFNGFDLYGYVNGKDVLDADERRRLNEIKPRILCEPRRISLLFTAA